LLGAKIGDNPRAKCPLHTPNNRIAPHIVKKGNYGQKMPLTYPKKLVTFLSKKKALMVQEGGSE
jgi:hypothetical protein